MKDHESVRLPDVCPFVSVKERLFDAASRLFNRKGYAATTVREIVTDSGVTKPALYYHFHNKEALFVAIIEQAMAEFLDVLEETRSVDENARASMHLLFARVFELAQRRRDVVRLVHGVLYGPREGVPRVDLHRLHGQFLGEVQRLVDVGIERGEFRAAEREATMLALAGAFNVCMERHLAYPDCPVDPSQVARVLDIVFDGVAKPDRERLVVGQTTQTA